MSAKRWRGRTRQELIIEVWEALDCESVGARELEEIQQVLRERFGAGAPESPASIARTVADEGAVLRHPEVFDCDTKWREQLISDSADLRSLNFSNLVDAAESIRTLEARRSNLASQPGQETQLRRLNEFALKTKEYLQLLAKSPLIEGKQRGLVREVIQWLTIWMQDPAIFEDWVSLRKRSPEFLKKFGD